MQINPPNPLWSHYPQGRVAPEPERVEPEPLSPAELYPAQPLPVRRVPREWIER